MAEEEDHSLYDGGMDREDNFRPEDVLSELLKLRSTTHPPTTSASTSPSTLHHSNVHQHDSSPTRARLTPEDIFNIMNLEREGFDGEPGEGTFYGAEESNVTSAQINDTLVRLVIPPEMDGGEDDIILPLLLSAIGLCAIIGNVLVLFAFFGFRRMRTGQNLMLVNVSVADLLFVLVTVPVAVLNHATGSHGTHTTPPPQLCRFVHYVIFVGVYVSIYTLVVTCVFRFFGEFMRGGKAVTGDADTTSSAVPVSRGCNGTIFSSSRPGGGIPTLTLGNAALSCAVIWIAFMTSHLNFLIQSEGAIFEEPFICEQYEGGPPDAAKLRTLWVTFLTCAFLLPLLIVCTLSALILRGGCRGGGAGAPGGGQGHRGEHVELQLDTNYGQSKNGQLLNDVTPRMDGRPLGCGDCSYATRGEGYGVRGEDRRGYRAYSELNGMDLDAPERHHYAHELSDEEGRRSARLFPNGSYSPGSRDSRDPRPLSGSPVPPPHIVAQQSPLQGQASPCRSLPPAAERHPPSDESAQNCVNDARSRRDLTVVVLASTVTRCLCWLPLQIFLLFDVFTPGLGGPLGATGPQGRPGDSAVAYRRAEMAAVCLAFAATCVNPVVYRCACAEFRRVYARMFARCGGRSKEKGRGRGALAPPTEMVGKANLRLVNGDMNETILSIISDSSNRINYVG